MSLFKELSWSKIVIFQLGLILSSCNIYAQESKSISFNLSSNYYVPLSNSIPLFSYGFAFHTTKMINKLSISLGVTYSNISFEETVSEWDSYTHLTRKKYEIEYLDFPLVFLFPNKEIKKVNVKALVGLIFNTERYYTETSYYDNSEPMVIQGKWAVQNIGISARGGLEISHFISTDWYIGLSPYIDVMFKPIHGESHPKIGASPIDKGIVFGTNLTIGYLVF